MSKKLREIKGNIWDYANKNSAVCVLTNDTILADGLNPMGGGIAREALDRNPGLDKIVAESIDKGTFWLCRDSKTKSYLYRLSTKSSVFMPSTLEHLELSLYQLSVCLECFKEVTFLIPRPGCGFGGLDWDTQVKPLCEKYLLNFNNYYIFSK